MSSKRASEPAEGQWPPEDGPWSRTRLTLCGRETTREDRQKPYNCWLVNDCAGVVGLFDCGCATCVSRREAVHARHSIDRAAEDLAEALFVPPLDVLQMLASEFGREIRTPQRSFSFELPDPHRVSAR